MKCETNPNNCPIEVTLSLIGGKYKPVILWFLIDHPLHYAELQRLIPKATPKMLSQQLHDLENSGIIHREVTGEATKDFVFPHCFWQEPHSYFGRNVPMGKQLSGRAGCSGTMLSKS